ncbi:unnamed protein product [Ceutorhynchus assimilis]|uniref:Uncharacterized protein n=1 Tax=Ceutorhynchus assimilis TaxID=467358 RepID=A0A9N9QQP7_9CUCU|nr:unnamed protein product [Ceutorhynchus assimilis]
MDVDDMEDGLNELEQIEKKSNLLVVGIPKQNEEARESLRKVFTAMKVTMQDEDIKEIYRINSKEDAPVMLKLETHEIRSTIFKKIKELKGKY